MCLFGRLWAFPGLSWCSLGHLLGSVGALRDPKWAPRGSKKHPKRPPRGFQEPSARGLPQRPLFDTFLGVHFKSLLAPISNICLFIFGPRLLLPAGCILGPKNAPRGCKTTLPSTQNCLKTLCFFVFCAHRLFRRFDASLCLLGPLLVPTLPLKYPFWHPF